MITSSAKSSCIDRVASRSTKLGAWRFATWADSRRRPRRRVTFAGRGSASRATSDSPRVGAFTAIHGGAWPF